MSLALHAASATVMVTGAAGFIGARIVRRLMNDGFDVTGVVRNIARARSERLGNDVDRSSSLLRLVECDFHDLAEARCLVESIRPSHCVHAAWDVASSDYRTSSLNASWINTSLHLFDALQASGCQWMGVMGTCLENVNTQRTCVYAQAKARLRQAIWTKQATDRDRSPMGVCWWKLFQPYGIGESQHRFVPSLIASLLNQEIFRIRAPDEVRDFIHVDDVAAAVSASIRQSVTGCFDLGTGVSHTLRDFATIVATQLNSIHLLDAARVPLHIPNSSDVMAAADCAPLERATGWRARFDVHQGAARCIAEARRRERAIV